jgi:hypothetical protein
MKKYIHLLGLSIFYAVGTSAQVDTLFTAKPRHNIRISTLNNNTVNGILTRTDDTSVFVYPGNFRDWNQQKTFPITVTPYSTINKIETQQKGGISILKGMLIGAGSGFATVLVASILSPKYRGEGAGLLALLTVPLGTITGGLVGGLSKKFQIGGDKTNFQQFRKKVKK